MKYSVFFFIGITLFSLIWVCCKDDNDIIPPDHAYLKVTEALSEGKSFNVQMYANDSLFVGYNQVFIKITDKNSGLPVTQASLALKPLMDMGTISHACPFENPASNLNIDGYFEGAVMFSMPGTNSWSLTIDISANGKAESVLLSIPKIISTLPARKIVVIDSVYTSQGTWIITKYPISLLIPKEWKVGNNPFELTIHRMESMMSFPAVTDLTIEIIPEMPSMGHGSPNNVNPVHTANGHYLGNVNFTMTGDWRINLVIKKGNRIITNKAWFDIIF